MNVANYKRRNSWKRLKNRLRYPPPFYKKVGGISAIVTRANGDVEDLGTVSDAYAKRWGVGASQ